MKDLSKLAVLIGLVLLVLGVSDWMQGFGWKMDTGAGVWVAILVLFLVARGGGCCGRRSCKPRA